MQDRITINTLQRLCDAMAKDLGKPAMAGWAGVGIAPHFNVGAFYVRIGSPTYGNPWELSEITNPSGGERRILSDMTARGLYNKMHAYWDGYQAAKADNTHV